MIHVVSYKQMICRCLRLLEIRSTTSCVPDAKYYSSISTVVLWCRSIMLACWNDERPCTLLEIDEGSVKMACLHWCPVGIRHDCGVCTIMICPYHIWLQYQDAIIGPYRAALMYRIYKIVIYLTTTEDMLSH